MHTDSAKAYRKLGPMKWMGPGAHHSEFEGNEGFKQLEITHTNVTHKRKPGEQVQYVAIRTVKLPDGEELQVKAGTEIIDGFWATLRAMVGRKGINTGKQGDNVKRETLYRTVRFAQWKHWYYNADRFKIFGTYLAKYRLANNFF